MGIIILILSDEVNTSECPVPSIQSPGRRVRHTHCVPGACLDSRGEVAAVFELWAAHHVQEETEL